MSENFFSPEVWWLVGGGGVGNGGRHILDISKNNIHKRGIEILQENG